MHPLMWGRSDKDMSLLDLLLLIIDNLNRRKARVALTAVGVVIGTAAVVMLVSLATGLQRNANEQLVGIGDLTQIQVSPNYGEGPIAYGPGGAMDMSNVTLITDQSLAEFAAIPGVKQVIARDYLMYGGTLTYDRLETWPNIRGVNVNDLSLLGLRAQQGSLELSKGSAVVGAMIAQNFYDPNLRPGQEPPPPPDLMGATVKLNLMKWDAEGNEIKKSIPIRITGVIAESRGEADWAIYMTMEDVTAMNEWGQGKRINRNQTGYNDVVVIVEDINQVVDVSDQIQAMGYQAWTPMSMVQGINSFYVVLQVIFGGVGAIALLVAAIGIANTMAMAILERTREIGWMKAIGATNRDVLSVFLGEAAGIGFIGGLGGVVLGWSASQIMNVLAMAYLAGQAAETGGMPPTVAVYTPPWLPVFALVFATLIGLLSGLYPALRAATLIPVNALKYE